MRDCRSIGLQAASLHASYTFYFGARTMKRILVDQKVHELAEYFLTDIAGVKPEDVTELAEDLQQRCEDFCRILENAAAEAGLPFYELKPDHGTPCWWILKDGVKHQTFTSLAAARGWLEHVLQHGEDGKKNLK